MCDTETSPKNLFQVWCICLSYTSKNLYKNNLFMGEFKLIAIHIFGMDSNSYRKNCSANGHITATYSISKLSL